MGYFHEAQISAKIWELRDEIAKLKRERRELLDERPETDDDMDVFMGVLAEIDERVEDLLAEHDDLERSLKFIRTRDSKFLSKE